MKARFCPKKLQMDVPVQSVNAIIILCHSIDQSDQTKSTIKFSIQKASSENKVTIISLWILALGNHGFFLQRVKVNVQERWPKKRAQPLVIPGLILPPFLALKFMKWRKKSLFLVISNHGFAFEMPLGGEGSPT